MNFLERVLKRTKMNLLSKIFIITMSAISCVHAYSSLPDSIDLLVRPATEDVMLYREYVNTFFKRAKDERDMCNGNSSRIGFVYIKKSPKNITEDLLIKSTEDNKFRLTLIDKLSSYADDNINGFGGVIFYYLSGDYIVFNGTSVDPNVVVNKKILISDISDFKILSNTLCEIVKELPLIGE